MNGYWNRMKVAKSFAALKKTLIYPTLMHSRGAAVLAERQRTGASVHPSGSNLTQNTSPQREAARYEPQAIAPITIRLTQTPRFYVNENAAYAIPF